VLEDYERVFGNKTQFFSSWEPEMIENMIIDHLRQHMNVEPKKIDANKYKIKFTLNTTKPDFIPDDP